MKKKRPIGIWIADRDITPEMVDAARPYLESAERDGGPSPMWVWGVRWERRPVPTRPVDELLA